MLLAPATQSAPPQCQQSLSEHLKAVEVSRYRIVVEVSLHDRSEPLPRFSYGIMHASMKLLLKLRQFAISQRSCSCCLPRITRTAASGLHLYGAQYPARLYLCLRFAAYLAIGLAQNSRPSGSLSGRRRRAVALASVRRPNCPYTFRVGSFHEDSARPRDKRRN